MKLGFEMAGFKCLFLKKTKKIPRLTWGISSSPNCLTCNLISLTYSWDLLKYLLVQLGIAAVHGPSVFACPFQS